MDQDKPNQPPEEQRMPATSKTKSNAMMNALIIGFMIGVVVWSVAKNTAGLLTLIPLFIIYRLVNSSKKDEP